MKPGTRVRIKGLVKASKHNGKTGLVTKASAPGNGRRVGVKLQDGSGAVLAIKIENLDKLEESPAAKTPKATTPKTKTTATAPTLPKERTLKRDNALLREFDGNPDPNVLVLYYHFGDRAFDCFNASEYNVQMLRYYEKGLSVKLIVPRKIGNNEYFLVGLQHAQHDKNTLCEVAFNCGRSFAGITMLVKKRCFACHKPLSSDSNNNNNNNNERETATTTTTKSPATGATTAVPTTTRTTTTTNEPSSSRPLRRNPRGNAPMPRMPPSAWAGI
mmetsp:Transcript_4298/g.10054  ORF Transcript_4298/g.10054 Transcript_4298/m.10054 type:complete len:273 (-) Transcript_4298:3799-4617(-)